MNLVNDYLNLAHNVIDTIDNTTPGTIDNIIQVVCNAVQINNHVTSIYLVQEEAPGPLLFSKYNFDKLLNEGRPKYQPIFHFHNRIFNLIQIAL